MLFTCTGAAAPHPRSPAARGRGRHRRARGRRRQANQVRIELAEDQNLWQLAAARSPYAYRGTVDCIF